MKLELFIIAVTGFFVINTYKDGKYIQIMKTWKKYYMMALYVIIGISIYIALKKFPSSIREICSSANGIIKYLPIDKNTSSMVTPIINYGKNLYKEEESGANSPQYKRLMNSGTKATKRSVGEKKKKFVAANQNWTCGHCKKQLEAWYEIDHKIRLENGGTNEVANLVALCRNCHGKKTAMENML